MSSREWKRPLGVKVTQLMHREAITHAQLSHPNILPFLGVYHEHVDSPPMMVLPFLERGSLQDFLIEQQLIAEDFQRIVLGIAEGVGYLHSRQPPIVHGDLHPGNVLLDIFGTPRLCDFGLSRIRHEVTRTRTLLMEGGRLRFLAPELAKGLTERFRTTLQSDIFSLAMTFLNLWTGKKPFSEIPKDRKVASTLKKGKRPTRPTVHFGLKLGAESDLWMLLSDMWAHDSMTRPSIGEVFERLNQKIFDPPLPSQASTSYILPLDSTRPMNLSPDSPAALRPTAVGLEALQKFKVPPSLDLHRRHARGESASPLLSYDAFSETPTSPYINASKPVQEGIRKDMEYGFPASNTYGGQSTLERNRFIDSSLCVVCNLLDEPDIPRPWEPERKNSDKIESIEWSKREDLGYLSPY
ncbi:kinase-like protein [Clavulina sp. PMI_390]|nr:kinase-like protein [Clavulina sp. PMI_390]